MSACPWLPNVAPFVEDDLLPAGRERMVAHFAECPTCRAERDAQETAVHALAALDAPGYDDALVGAIMAAVDSEPRPSRVRGWALNGAALVALVVAGWWAVWGPTSAGAPLMVPSWVAALGGAVAASAGVLVDGTFEALHLACLIAVQMVPYALAYACAVMFLSIVLRGKRLAPASFGGDL